jgi:hypothetical protein
MKMLIDEKISSIEKEKAQYLDVKAKLLAEKKHKEVVLRQIREDFESRREAAERRKEYRNHSSSSSPASSQPDLK